MANILTVSEAANALRCEQDDENMLDLLPLVDAYIQNATGHDWAADSTVHESAKAAARILLALWHENPAQISTQGALPWGLSAALAQLEALALRYSIFEGLSGAGWVSLPGAQAGDTVTALVGVVGATGSQAANFASVIEYDGLLEQTSTSDLTDKYYRVLLTPPA